MTHRTLFTLSCLSCLLLSSCGYRLGGVKPKEFEKINNLHVSVFTNDSVEPRAAVLTTSAIADAIQKDGTFRLASKGNGEARLVGRVNSIRFIQLRSSSEDTYLSTERGLVLNVDYSVIDSKTNKVILSGNCSEMANFFNSANQQSAKEAALSYAARLVATQIANQLANG